MTKPMHPLAQLDHRHVWHPFTQMRDWLRQEPIVIASGRGAVLRDVYGTAYLDANSSIWTNLHGHRHPTIDAALRRQLRRIAHSSALGLANEPASRLAARLIALANRVPTPGGSRGTSTATPTGRPVRHLSVDSRHFEKVFFSDDGSTALEVALKLAYEVTRRRRGLRSRPRFLSIDGAYHGDTVGAVSLGHVDLFHRAYAGLLFKSDKVMAPYCYRCPFNRAKPERADAREHRRCGWECIGKFESALRIQKKRGTGDPYAAFVFEPLMQGAAGMIPQPRGWLKQVTDLARAHGALLVADEVMTGCGRAGLSETGGVSHDEADAPAPSVTERAGRRSSTGTLACSLAGVRPDFLCVAKGLTGGYLPMAATLTTQAVFDEFLGDYGEFKTFFHGHSYTGNQLGAAAALASLDLLEAKTSIDSRRRLERNFENELQVLWRFPNVGDIRRVGLVAGIELVKDWRTREPFDLREQAGIRVCTAMARRGVLTRPIGNVIVLMPPYCTTATQLRKMVSALGEAVAETFSAPGGVG